MHTVRQAYQRLEAQGLVSIRTRRGTVVLPYDPAAVAQRGADSPSYLIGVILPSPASFYVPFIRAIQEGARDLRYLPLFCYTFENPYLAETYFNQLIARQVDGFIMASLSIPNLVFNPETINKYPPIVTADMPDMPGYRVLLDTEGAAYQAANHLLDHGYKRIGLVTPPLDWANVRQFYDGYQRALHDVGYGLEDDLVVQVEGFFEENGASGAARLLDLDHPPEAILFASDSLALGGMEWIKERGLSVPEDIALVGYNDIPAASLVTPGLTTTAVPAARMGMLALQTLRDLMDGKKPSQEINTIPTELIIRHSCGC
jgi:LacI family transcriptional regulator